MAANSSAAQVRIDRATASQVGGQRAHDLRVGAQPAYVDKNRLDKNRVLIRPATGSELRKICEERRKQRDMKRAMKSNAVVGITGVITFGHAAQLIFEKLNSEQQNAAYFEVAEEVAKRLGTSLHGLVHHGDETSPHAHFLLSGVGFDGKPVSKTANRAALRALQDITAEVMGRHAPGIQRGTPRRDRIQEGETYAETVYKKGAEMRALLGDELPALRKEKNDLSFRIKDQSDTVRKLHDQAEKAAQRGVELREQIAEAATDLEAAQAKAAKNERLAEKARAKAEADESRAAKALKNVETYERRAEDARRAVENTTEHLEALRSSVRRLEASERALRASVSEAEAELETVETSVAQKKTKKASLLEKLRSLSAV